MMARSKNSRLFKSPSTGDLVYPKVMTSGEECGPLTKMKMGIVIQPLIYSVGVSFSWEWVA